MTEAPAGITGPSRLPKPAWTLVLASLGLFMSALDNMVVTTALPVLRVSLHASLSGLEWTVNAYLLSFAAASRMGPAGPAHGAMPATSRPAVPAAVLAVSVLLAASPAKDGSHDPLLLPTPLAGNWATPVAANSGCQPA